MTKGKIITIGIPIKVKCWKNRSGVWLIYSKKFDMSGYGETMERAISMFQVQVTDILLRSMSAMQKKHSKK